MIRVARGLVTIMMGAGVLGPVMNATAQTGQEAVSTRVNTMQRGEGAAEEQPILCNRKAPSRLVAITHFFLP
jgi:hypothetical protein